mmetsp:Transcript_6550/g.12085  ORF Transcript_6550/g.12085 Transcript_6550/m.12085 type:complete len:510 (-) Transcript_6550:286-1815(-)
MDPLQGFLGDFLLDYNDLEDAGQLANVPEAVVSTAQPDAHPNGQAFGGGPACGSAEAGSSQSSAASETENGRTELDARAWFKRRRDQIAKASRKARLKKRMKIDELHEENKKLREERNIFLKKIESLESKVAELKFCGQVDVQLEHELLVAQLEEHKRFLSGCFKLQHGIPSSQNVYANLQAQGTRFAETYVQSLLSRSCTENWTPLKFKPGYFKTLVPGYHLAGCFRRLEGSNSINVRFDLAIDNATVEECAGIHWGMWTDAEVLRSRFGVTFPFQLSNIEIPTTTEEERANVGTMCYVEYPKENETPSEWVFVMSRKYEQLVKSTLVMPRACTPALARGESADGTPLPDDAPIKKRRKRAKVGVREPATVGTFGKANGCILSRSTTQHCPSDTQEGTQRIKALYIEGAVYWRQGVIRENFDLDASFQDVGDEEQLIERKTCTRASVVASLPDNSSLDLFGASQDIVEENGYLSEKYSGVLDRSFRDLFDQLAKKERQQQWQQPQQQP